MSPRDKSVLLLCNARSIRNAWPEFKAAAAAYNPSIIAITETWLSTDISMKFTYFQYSQFAVSRDAAHPGGGVMLLFKPTYSVYQKSIPVETPNACDVLPVVDTSNGHCWVLVYRPPNCNAKNTSQLCKYLDCILTEHKSVTVMGDLNMRNIDWSISREQQCLDTLQRKFLQFCHSWDLHQMVSRPTRGHNQLDIVLTTHHERFSDVRLVPPLVSSDHDAVICNVHQTAKGSQPVRLERCFLYANYAAIAHELSKCDWQIIFSNCVSVNDYWLAFYQVLLELVEVFVPIRAKRQGNGGFCGNGGRTRLPKAIRKLLLIKRRAWRRWRAYPTALNKADFNEASRRCRSDIRQYLANQENNLLKVGSRKFFYYAARQLHPQQCDIMLRTTSGLACNPTDICTILSAEFATNFDGLPYGATAPLPACEDTHRALPCLSNINIDTVTVRQTLEQLHESAAGPDDIPGIFYKRLACWLAYPLTVVYQQSVYRGRIPDAWRMARVTPIFKQKGDKTDPSNYRPISLTSIACKILERIIVSQLQEYLSSNALNCQQQHGFMPKRSTATNLLQCDDRIAQHLNNKTPCDVFMLDFTRAFDKVSHEILKTKLTSVGICGKLYEWIADFLSGREVAVCMLQRRRLRGSACHIWRYTRQCNRMSALLHNDN